MSTEFRSSIGKLKKVITRFDAASNEVKRSLLRSISKCELPCSRSLVNYGDLLLFIQAFPPDRRIMDAAEKESSRVARFLSRSTGRSHKTLVNSGLPHTPYTSKFSHDLSSWLMQDDGCRIQIDQFDDAEFDLNKVLAITLPSLERSETTAEAGNMELLAALGVSHHQEVRFLLNELKKVDHAPRIKDLLFDGLGLNLRILPKNKSFSRAFNRLPTPRPFFHDRILKEFDHHALLDRPLGGSTPLSGRARNTVIRVVKRSMALTDRETDPTTYLDERTLRLYELERGISVAIYGMMPPRQLPLESYFGYTLFKNGFPVAYGGAWVFGRRADFGINIFEAFRGGESGYALCQLLRVFRQVFKVEHFEIEPYQFGLDNPDGITTGAFWFYHRYGFRPTDPKLLELSENEMKKRKARKHHRTSSRALLRFTGSNMALALSKVRHPGVYDISDRVKQLIRVRYKGDRAKAENECVRKFFVLAGRSEPKDPVSLQVLKEVALWAQAMKQRDPEKLKLLVYMIGTKAADPFLYQELLLRYFEKPEDGRL